jgi:hypothetical protein
MNQAKRRKLQKAGFKIGSVQDSLGLSDYELAMIVKKIASFRTVKSKKGPNKIGR